MKELTPIEIKDKLIESGLLSKRGSLNFSFLDSEITYVVKDSFGYLFQSWLTKWFNDNDIYSRENKNSQEPPDFYLKKDSDNSGFLEIKTFYENPSFDIHGWDAYLNLLIDKPYHIDADFMIFNYDISSKGDYFTIKNIYVKKIWEISRRMKRGQINFPVNVQYKNQTIVNLRPVGISDLETDIFEYDRKEFLSAIQDTIDMYDKARDNHKDGKWLEKVIDNYKIITGNEI